MKKLSSILMLSMIAMSLSFVSCDKDDEDTKKNQFTYDGVDYALAKGIIENYGLWNYEPNTYNFDLSFFSSGLIIDEDADVTGTGDGLYFEMFSSSETELLPGTYTFDAEESGDANTFDIGMVVVNFNSTTETSDVEKDVTSGTVKVEKDGTTYTITIDCVVEGGKTVKGYYKGTLSMYDWTDFLKLGVVDRTELKKF